MTHPKFWHASSSPVQQFDPQACVEAHIAWRARLAKYLDDGSELLDPVVVARDDQCVLGQVLVANGGNPACAAHPAHIALVAVHAAFHQSAGRVVEQAASGDLLGASMTLRGEFHGLSDQVIACIHAYPKEFSQSEAYGAATTERFYSLLEASSEAVLFLGPHLQVELINDRFRRLFQVPFAHRVETDMVMNHLYAAVVDPVATEQRVRHWQLDRQACQLGDLNLRDGTWLQVDVRPIRTFTGEVTGWLWLFVDVTDRREREAALLRERAATENLLHAILPAEIVPQMLANGAVAPILHPDAVVCFVDFVAFTRMTRTLRESALIAHLDRLFRLFDDVVNRHGLEKIKTIGDAYMFAGNVPTRVESAHERAVLVALEIQTLLAAQPTDEAGAQWLARIGLNCGPVVAGVIGDTKFSYDIWGDTVNVAARVQQHCRPARIALSAEMHDRVRGSFRCTSVGRVVAKNRGEIEVFEVDGSVASDALVVHLQRSAHRRQATRSGQVRLLMASRAMAPLGTSRAPALPEGEL